MSVRTIEALQRYLRRLCEEAVPPEDAVLLQRFVTANDRDAFELLIARYGPMVLGTARRLVADTHDAEDALCPPGCIRQLVASPQSSARIVGCRPRHRRSGTNNVTRQPHSFGGKFARRSTRSCNASRNGCARPSCCATSPV